MEVVLWKSYSDYDDISVSTEMSSSEDFELSRTNKITEYFQAQILDTLEQDIERMKILYLLSVFEIDLISDIDIWNSYNNWEIIITECKLSEWWIKKLKKLFIYLEIEKQIEDNLVKNININDGASKIVWLYSADNKWSLDLDSPMFEENVVDLLKWEPNNKFLLTIQWKIQENKIRISNNQVYKNKLRTLQKDYNLEMYFKDFCWELSQKYKKPFGQLYKNVLNEVNKMDLSISYLLKQKNIDFIDEQNYLRNEKSIQRDLLKQDRIKDPIDDAEKRKFNNYMKSAILGIMLSTGYWIYDSNQWVDSSISEKNNYSNNKLLLQNNIEKELNKMMSSYHNLNAIKWAIWSKLWIMIQLSLWESMKNYNTLNNYDKHNFNFTVNHNSDSSKSFSFSIPISARFDKQYPYGEDYEIK